MTCPTDQRLNVFSGDRRECTQHNVRRFAGRSVIPNEARGLSDTVSARELTRDFIVSQVDG
jgi:hypothetical protein